MNAVEVSQKLIENILHDNGLINRYEKQRCEDWIYKICDPVENFFGKNPDLLNDDFFDLITMGCIDEFEKYASLEGFKELQDILNEFFESEIFD